MFNADENYLAKFSPRGGAHSVCWERLFRIYYDDNDYYNLSIAGLGLLLRSASPEPAQSKLIKCQQVQTGVPRPAQINVWAA